MVFSSEFLFAIALTEVFFYVFCDCPTVLLRRSKQPLIKKVCLRFNPSKSSPTLGQSKCTRVGSNRFSSQVSVLEQIHSSRSASMCFSLPELSYLVAHGNHTTKISIKKVFEYTGEPSFETKIDHKRSGQLVYLLLTYTT